MTTRFLAVLATLWLFTCVPFFLVGEAYLDPSSEYGEGKLFWVSVTRWLALIAPPLLLWALSRFLNSQKPWAKYAED